MGGSGFGSRFRGSELHVNRVTALLIIAGLVLLVFGGELLVRGASRLATALGISPLVIGLTVVAFGTSAPELAVGVQAAWAGTVDIAMGNVVGSNICNVLLILGIAATIVPLTVSAQMIRQEVPILIGVSLLLYFLALDGVISRMDGAVFVGLTVAYTALLVVQSRRAKPALADEYSQETHIVKKEASGRHWSLDVGLLVVGLATLVLGSRFLVDGASAVARALGVSELIIGLSVVAIGTSLPEVAASVIAAFKGQRDIAVGNAIGSSIFNILFVLGLSALASPSGLPVGSTLLEFDMLVMIGVAVACLPVFFTGYTIARWEGAVFVGYYLAYTTFLVLEAQGSVLVDGFAWAMTMVVLPLTLLTIGVVTVRAVRVRRDQA